MSSLVSSSATWSRMSCTVAGISIVSAPTRSAVCDGARGLLRRRRRAAVGGRRPRRGWLLLRRHRDHRWRGGRGRGRHALRL
eukprot:scaffold41839_cov71-Phaeocystis_antarctica.AAC.2